MMPQMGESVVEGTVTKWLVKVGDRVTEDQPLCEISTDKVDTEIPSPSAGVIARLIAAEGQTLPVGAAIARIDTGAAAAAAGPTPPKPSLPQVPNGQPAALSIVSRPEQLRVVSRLTTQSGAAAVPRRYSPVVLRMAEANNIDLNLVPATGLGGRVSKRDVERYIESLQAGAASEPAVQSATHVPIATPVSRTTARADGGAQASAVPAAGAGPAFRPSIYQPRAGDTVEPFSRRRKLIAEHMVFSKTHSPHVGTVAEVDLSRLAALRDQHKLAFQAREGFALSLLPFAAMATVRALKEFPRMNASVAGDAVVIRREINLGIAMDAEEGLVVPVIRQADTFTVIGLAREVERLRRKVQERTIAPDDLAGGSFTLSNPGREGNLYGFAIINQPQVGILRMGEVKKRPLVIELDGADAIAIRTMMYLALSYDHRVIDGVLGNRFLFRTARILEAAEFEL
jgi:2-oxoglutarate dehydrogenase E2 component (dihydrolipoamide succinyltransferase)